MIAEQRPLAEITEEALRLLYRDMGIVNTVRFLSQFTTGFGNCIEERRVLIETQTIDDVLADVRSIETAKAAR